MAFTRICFLTNNLKRMKKKLVFILSSNFSGSHFLSLLLGSHSRALHLGETKNLVKETISCCLCGNTSDCELFRNIEYLKKDNLYPTLFNRAGDEIHILVDTSKKIKWASQFSNIQEDYEIKFIHLVRDPRALVRRWKLTYSTPFKRLKQRKKVIRTFIKKISKLLFIDQETIYLYKWLNQNQQITQFILENDFESQVVTYHDLTTKTSEIVTNLMLWLGQQYEPSQLEYWNFQHHGTEKHQYEWIKANKITTHVDLRWKDELTPEQNTFITNNTDVKNYIHSLGLQQHDDGLTKIN